MLCNVENALDLVSWLDKNSIPVDCLILTYPDGAKTARKIIDIQRDSRFSPAAQVMDVLSDIATKADMTVSDFIVDDMSLDQCTNPCNKGNTFHMKVSTK